MGDECPFYDDDDLDPPEIIAEEPVPEDEEDEEEEEGYEGNEEEDDDEEEGNEESSSEPDDEDVKELRDVENEDWDGNGKSVEEPLAIAAAGGDDDDDLAPPAKRVRFEDALAQVEEDDGDLPSAVFSDNPIVSEVKLEAESPRFPEAMIAAAMIKPEPWRSWFAPWIMCSCVWPAASAAVVAPSPFEPSSTSSPPPYGTMELATVGSCSSCDSTSRSV